MHQRQQIQSLGVNQPLKFHYSSQGNSYQFKWQELQTYLNKINVHYIDAFGNKMQNAINFTDYVVCYIRIDFGLKETKIYATNPKMPALFGDYVMLNYCDHIVLLWCLSWFGCENWQTFERYCEKYGSRLDELVCFGVSFDVDEGIVSKVTIDGNEKGQSKRINLDWKKEAYTFAKETAATNHLKLNQNNSSKVKIRLKVNVKK
jgi:hypothetical protein